MGGKEMADNIRGERNAKGGPDGAVDRGDSETKTGEQGDMRDEMNVMVVLANGPERDNAASGDGPTPIRAVVYTPG